MVIALTWNQLDAIAEERFLDQVLSILRDAYPEASKALSTVENRLVMRKLCAKARGYGFVSELDLARYVITAWLLGLDFDTRYEAMAQILASPSLSPPVKAEAMERVTVTLLDTLARGAKR